MSQNQNFGRPKDEDIEKEFMEKIRDVKLNSINSQSQLELQLAFDKSKVESEESLSDLLRLFGKVTTGEKVFLQQQFRKFKDAWVFEEIDASNLPQYFFDDGSDYSYILYMIYSEDKERMDFNEHELLYLQLLTLNSRKQLNENIIKLFDQNYDLLMKLLKEIKKVVKDHYEEKEKTKTDYVFQPMKEFEDKDYDSVRELSDNKNKPIKKPEKNKRKNRRKKSSESSESENEENKGANKDKEQIRKLINYISWAYRYIYKEVYDRNQLPTHEALTH